MVQLDSCQIDFELTILKEDQEIPLTAKEYSLLKVLYDHKNKIVTFDQLLSKVWGDNYQRLWKYAHGSYPQGAATKIEANPSKPVHLITIKGLELPVAGGLNDDF